MDKISTVGLDIAKHVFQVHGEDEAGQVVVRRQLRRAAVVKFFANLPPCVVGMEACSSAYYWAREIGALGHDVRLMPPVRVKAYVKWGRKNDAADAAAICEAVRRPSMRFVPVKTVEQQAVMMLHQARRLLVAQRTRLSNAVRGHMAELGIIAAKGAAGFTALLRMVDDAQDERLPALARAALAALASQWHSAGEQIDALDERILAWHKSDADSLRLATIPQIGPIIASALVARTGDARRFRNGRQFAAWLGLVPLQNSSGGKERLGHITKTGDGYLRQLLVISATGMIRRVRANPALAPWVAGLLARMPAKKAAIAFANKLARIAWAILAHGGVYQARHVPAAG
jgi:transposase